MQFVISPTEEEVFQVIRTFLLAVLPKTTKRIIPVTLSDGEHPTQEVDMEVFRFNENRVAEPVVLDYIIITPFRRDRLSTNIDISVDVRFTGFVVGTLLTVTSIEAGTIALGSKLFGVGVLPGTFIESFGSGSTGGIGTYTLSLSQALSSRTLAAGETSILDPVQLSLQLDVHGPQSPDVAAMLEALFRDEYAVEQFQALNPAVIPLYPDGVMQMPFVNDQKQYEYRWICPLAIEVNGIVKIPQEFAETLTMGLINVDVVYPVS